MFDFLKNSITTDELYKEIKAKEYVCKYVKELQRHFDIPDKRIRFVLLRAYMDLLPFKILKFFMKNKFEMVKFFYRFKRDNR